MTIDYNPPIEYDAEIAVRSGRETWFWRTEDADLIFD